MVLATSISESSVVVAMAMMSMSSARIAVVCGGNKKNSYGSHDSDVLVVVDGMCISRLGRWLQDWELVWQQEILDLEYPSCDL